MTHPITPPPELVQEWASAQEYSIAPAWVLNDFAQKAAQWGADQELEACCEALDMQHASFVSKQLRTARRPKPPSLKQQVLATLQYPKDLWSEDEVDAIRRLVEQLDD